MHQVTGNVPPGEETLQLLRCPRCRARLTPVGTGLRCTGAGHTYEVADGSIPLFAQEHCSPEGQIQREHYDRIARHYLANLGYPHTQQYQTYLDDMLESCVPDRTPMVVAELCFGRGEGMRHLGDRVQRGVGLDVSLSMLTAAREELRDPRYVLVQGEATNVPMADACVDLVIMLGGIHHVPDRERLFREVHRILRPGGHFLFREPLSDLFLWRWVRGVIYRLSPSLDADTERPLSRHDTEPILEAAGLTLEEWRPCGLLGYCLLMNSDVLVVNRLLRFVPGIASFTRFMAHVDHHLLSIPDLQVAGLQVVGRARRRPSLTRAATIPENRRPNPGPRQEPHSA